MSFCFLAGILAHSFDWEHWIEKVYPIVYTWKGEKRHTIDVGREWAWARAGFFSSDFERKLQKLRISFFLPSQCIALCRFPSSSAEWISLQCCHSPSSCVHPSTWKCLKSQFFSRFSCACVCMSLWFSDIKKVFLSYFYIHLLNSPSTSQHPLARREHPDQCRAQSSMKIDLPLKVMNLVYVPTPAPPRRRSTSKKILPNNFYVFFLSHSLVLFFSCVFALPSHGNANFLSF